MELVTKYDPDRPQPDDDDYLSSDIEQDYAEQWPTRRKVDTAIAAVAKLTEQMGTIQATLAEVERRQEQAQVPGGKGGKGGYPQQGYQGGKGGKGAETRERRDEQGSGYEPREAPTNAALAWAEREEEEVAPAIAAVAKLAEQMRKIQATLAEMGRRQEQAQVQGSKGGPPSQQGQGGNRGKGGYPQQSYQGGQSTMQGKGAPPPMPCAYCTRRGQDANHEYKHCQHYVGCGICKGPGHYSKECVMPCPGCGQTSLILNRRHRQGCYKMPIWRPEA